MARPVPALRLLGREGFLDIIIDQIPRLINRVAHPPLMDVVFLFHGRQPDKVQAICREQESSARLIIRNLFINLLYAGNGIGVEWI